MFPKDFLGGEAILLMILGVAFGFLFPPSLRSVPVIAPLYSLSFPDPKIIE